MYKQCANSPILNLSENVTYYQGCFTTLAPSFVRIKAFNLTLADIMHNGYKQQVGGPLKKVASVRLMSVSL